MASRTDMKAYSLFGSSDVFGQDVVHLFTVDLFIDVLEIGISLLLVWRGRAGNTANGRRAQPAT